jgi:hypothetical protein
MAPRGPCRGAPSGRVWHADRLLRDRDPVAGPAYRFQPDLEQLAKDSAQREFRLRPKGNSPGLYVTRSPATSAVDRVIVVGADRRRDARRGSDQGVLVCRLEQRAGADPPKNSSLTGLRASFGQNLFSATMVAGGKPLPRGTKGSNPFPPPGRHWRAAIAGAASLRHVLLRWLRSPKSDRYLARPIGEA